MATITHLLDRWAHGEPEVVEPLIERTYRDLEQIARKALRTERQNHTLCSAALINECYLKLRARRVTKWASRTQFFGFAAQAMRRILIDYARGHRAAKRGGGTPTILLESIPDRPGRQDVEPADLIALDRALDSLTRSKPRLGQVVELKFFGGLGIDDIAEILETSRATVKRDWTVAKKWLAHALSNAARQAEEDCVDDRRTKAPSARPG